MSGQDHMRTHLGNLSRSLLRLHKALVDSERAFLLTLASRLVPWSVSLPPDRRDALLALPAAAVAQHGNAPAAPTVITPGSVSVPMGGNFQFSAQAIGANGSAIAGTPTLRLAGGEAHAVHVEHLAVPEVESHQHLVRVVGGIHVQAIGIAFDNGAGSRRERDCFEDAEFGIEQVHEAAVQPS